ncbi:MAG: hypothetical protein AABZ60_19450 [Planctomycetota bacterium]
MRLIYLGYILFFSLIGAQENTVLLEKWIKKLGHSSWKVREKATKALIQQKENATATLQKALSSRDPEIAWRVQYILAQAPETENNEIKQLIRDFSSFDQNQYVQAEKSLKKMGFTVVPHLQKALENERNRSIQNRLKKLIQEISQPLPPDSVTQKPSLIEREFQLALRDFYNEKKQYQGVILLKALGDEIFPYLDQELQKPSIAYNKRIQLIQIIGNIRKKEMIDCLVNLTEDSDGQVAQFAHMKLQILTDQQKISRLRWKEWWTTNRETFQFP